MSASKNGARKPRKKSRPPQQISEETWKAIELAIVAGGLGYSECGRKFGVSAHAIMGRCKRHGWAVPSKIEERAAALQARSKLCQSDRNGNELVIQAVAEDWASRGETHRSLAFQLAHDSLRQAAKEGLPATSWRDAHMADTVARRSAALDHEDHAVNIGLQLIDARILASNLPLDAFKHLEETSAIPEAKTPA